MYISGFVCDLGAHSFATFDQFIHLFVFLSVPSVVNPKGRGLRLDSIHKTWGPYARAIFVLHNQTEFPQGSHLTFSEEKEPSDTFSYPQTLLLPDIIGVDDGLPRLYYTIRSIHERVDPDFCFFVNDHTFVIPEHLCTYLDGIDPGEDLYAGHALRNGKEDVFNSGAAGYLLSRGTMKKLMKQWDAHADKCWLGPDASPWLQGNPGLVTAQCLESIDVHATDTREDGKFHRFHAFPLTRVVAGKVDGWYNQKHDGMEIFDGFDKSYSELLKGEDCCSRETVSFHYVDYMECMALFATREALIRTPRMSDDQLKSFILKTWPKERSDYGFYSMVLPKLDDDEEWKPLLAVIRKISLPSAPDADCLLM